MADNKTKNFIERSLLLHGQKYDYSKTIYTKNNIHVIIICLIHGEFLQTPSKHLIGRGCKKCGNERHIGNYRNNPDEILKNLIVKHENKYDYSKFEYKGVNNKIIIICPIHGEFKQMLSNHMKGHGCKKCANEDLSLLKTLTKQEFIKKAIELHKDEYDYSKIQYKSSDQKIIIICKKHGEFLQTPNGHLCGNGCKKCGIESNSKAQIGLNKFERRQGIILNTKEDINNNFIKKAIEIHGDKYDYSLVQYGKNNSEKIIINCQLHGTFEQTPICHLSGSGCSLCGLDLRSENRRKSQEEFINDANLIHNFKYDYSKVNYFDWKTKITIICKEHGDFQQVANDHLQGNGCIRCTRKGFSKVCNNWLEIISQSKGINIQYVLNNCGEKIIKIENKIYKLDGYLEQKNIVFEFYGCFWHGCKKCFCEEKVNNVNGKTMKFLYDRTIDRENSLIKNGFKLVTIWECEFNEMINDENKLNNYLYNLKL